MRMNLIMCCFLFFSFINVSLSQKKYASDVERSKLIKEQLSDGHKNKIRELEDDENKAENQMNVADNYYKELSKYRLQLDNIKERKKRNKILKKAIKVENKALKNRVESLDSYHEVIVQKYQIYKDDLQKFLKTAKAAKLDSAKKWETLAYESFEKADVKVQIAYHTVNHGDLFNIYTEAYVLEQIGILYEEQMYGVFLNWPEATMKRIRDEINALRKNEPLNSESEEIIISELNSSKDTVLYKTVVVYDTVKVQTNIPGLIYKIQIAASKVPLSITQLRKIYHADDIINTVIENEWYKYSVGMFDTYREAQKFKINIGVSDAFIVAYKQGKKVEISNKLETKKIID